MNHVVMFSGGIGSFVAAQKVIGQEGTANVKLLFTDTKTEDADLYRFIEESSQYLGVPLVTIADGRDIWQVFSDEKFLGNSRVDPCSKILKRQLADKWIKEHYSPDEVIVYVGIDWSEQHRYDRMAPRKLPYVYKAPLTEPPYLDRDEMLRRLKVANIEIPRLYKLGFPHNNCGGGCIKAGQGHFALLLDKLPDVYEQWESQEQKLREELGDVSILKDRRGGSVKPLTLKTLRERITHGDLVDKWDFGGCGCFLDDEDAIQE